MEKSSDVDWGFNTDCEMLRFAVNKSLFMLFLNTMTVDAGMFEVKLSLVMTSQSFG